jgi:hypothetical protein
VVENEIDDVSRHTAVDHGTEDTEMVSPRGKSRILMERLELGGEFGGDLARMLLIKDAHCCHNQRWS